MIKNYFDRAASNKVSYKNEKPLWAMQLSIVSESLQYSWYSWFHIYLENLSGWVVFLKYSLNRSKEIYTYIKNITLYLYLYSKSSPVMRFAWDYFHILHQFCYLNLNTFTHFYGNSLQSKQTNKMNARVSCFVCLFVLRLREILKEISLSPSFAFWETFNLIYRSCVLDFLHFTFLILQSLNF